MDTATADLVPQSSRHQARQSFTPRFDVREIGSNYELQGELPGLVQKDLEIEFVDERTLVIRGRTATENAQTNEPVKAVAADEQAANPDNASDKSANYRKPSVEEEDYVDAGAESASSATEGGAKTPTSNVPEKASQQVESKAAEPNHKYWVSERAVGEFERRFSFPGRVDQEAVKASLRNGILSVVVPKIVAQEARRINIE